MKGKNFRIELLTKKYFNDSSTTTVVCPGQEVSGFVHFVTKKEFQHEGIYVLFKGKAKIRLDMGKRSYLATENYPKVSIQLMAPGSTITLGEYHFPFKLKVPVDLPNSFRWNKGSGIFYKMIALIKRPALSCHKSRLRVTVPLHLLSLSNPPIMTVTNEPLMKTIQKFKSTTSGPLACCCIIIDTGGPVGFKVTLSKRVIDVQEPIKLSTDLINHSRSKVKCTAVSFVQKVTFYCREYELPYEKKLIEVKGPGLGPEETKTWLAKFEIPTDDLNVVPSGLEHCKIIDVDYFICVEMRLLNKSLVQKIPIFVHRMGDSTMETLKLNSDPALVPLEDGHVNEAFVF